MAHAQKPDFVFRRHGRVHLKSARASVQSNTGSRGVRISGSNVEYSMFRSSVKSTGYPLDSPVSPSFPLPYVTVCRHISTGVYRVIKESLLDVIINDGCKFKDPQVQSEGTQFKSCHWDQIVWFTFYIIELSPKNVDFEKYL
jgi:hypothetical protein